MRAPAALLLSAVVVAVAACGGTPKAKTVVQTVTTPAPTAPAQTTPPTETTEPAPAETETAPTATTAVPKEPLPGGRPAVDGKYALTLKRFSPDSSSPVPNDTTPRSWYAQTMCPSASTCSVKLRRPVAGGGFKEYTMQASGPRNYFAEVTGRITTQDVDYLFPCYKKNASGTRERASIHVSKIEMVDGRPTATALEAYLIVRGSCAADDTRTHGPFKLTASFRGGRVG